MKYLNTVFAAALLLAACSGQPVPEPLVSTGGPADGQITGIYLYQGMGVNAQTDQEFRLSGTITFEPDGNRVRVSATTYDGASLRPLDSEFGELDDDTVLLSLAPSNGDSGYRAEVTFVFSSDRSEFQVTFEDTNNDMGELGSFVGVFQGR